MSSIKLLCVDDEKNVLRALERLFFDEEYELITAGSADEGLLILDKEKCQIIISDYRMPGMNGVDFLRKARELCPESIRIVLSGYADVPSIVSAINEGEIYKFLAKPWNDEELKKTIGFAIEKYNLEKENRELTTQVFEKNSQLEELNRNLERLVDEKTSDLQFQNKVLTLSQNILNALPLGIVGVDTSRHIVQVNDYANTIFQESCGNILGENIADVLTDETIDHMELSIKTGEVITGSAEGYSFTGQVICSPLTREKKLEGYIVIFSPDHTRG